MKKLEIGAEFVSVAQFGGITVLSVFNRTGSWDVSEGEQYLGVLIGDDSGNWEFQGKVHVSKVQVSAKFPQHITITLVNL